MSPAPIRYKDLPDGLCPHARQLQNNERIFGYLSKPLIDDLVAFIDCQNVLEVYAGRGHLAALLAERGVSIKSTSLRQGHDGSYDLGHVCEVIEMDAVSAVVAHRNWADILLVSWPTTDMGLTEAIKYLPTDVFIIFIGEVTDYNQKPPFLGGCATDKFFENVQEIKELSELIRYPTYGCDKIKVYRKI